MKKKVSTGLLIREFFFLFDYFFWSEGLKRWSLLLARIMQYVAVSLIIGFTHATSGDETRERLAIVNISRTLSTVLPLPFEAQLLMPVREYLSCGLNGILFDPLSMFLARFASYWLFRSWLVLIYTSIVYPIAPMRAGIGHFLIFLLTLLIHQFSKTAVGFLILTLFPTSPVLKYEAWLLLMQYELS